MSGISRIVVPPRCGMPTLAALALWIWGCASNGPTNDVSEIRRLLRDRAAPDLVRAVQSGPDRPDTPDPEVERLLASPLTAETAVRVAALENRDLRAGLVGLGVWRGQAAQAGLVPNPEVTVDVRKSRDPAVPLQMDLGLDYNLTGLVLTRIRRSVAEARLSAERLRVAGDVLETLYRVRLAFYEAQGRRQLVDLRRRALEAFEAGYEAALALERAGNVPLVDVATQRAQVEAARVTVSEAENAWLEARTRLVGLMGVTAAPSVGALELAGTLPPPEGELGPNIRSERAALAASLELAEVEQRLEVATRSLGLARAEGLLPPLSAGFHAERDEAIWELGGHVTVGIPLFDRAQGRQQEARAELGALRQRHLAVANEVRAAHRRALLRFDATARQARQYRDQVIPALETALDQTLLQYNAMQVNVFALLAAQRAVTEAATRYVDKLVEHWRARAALETIAAGRHRGVAAAAESPVRMGEITGVPVGH